VRSSTSFSEQQVRWIDLGPPNRASESMRGGRIQGQLTRPVQAHRGAIDREVRVAPAELDVSSGRDRRRSGDPTLFSWARTNLDRGYNQGKEAKFPFANQGKEAKFPFAWARSGYETRYPIGVMGNWLLSVQRHAEEKSLSSCPEMVW